MAYFAVFHNFYKFISFLSGDEIQKKYITKCNQNMKENCFLISVDINFNIKKALREGFEPSRCNAPQALQACAFPGWATSAFISTFLDKFLASL